LHVQGNRSFPEVTGHAKAPAPSWVQVKDGHPVARELFGRHYTYRTRRNQLSFFPEKNRNFALFVGPGQKMVLLSEDQTALFVWRKFISMDNQRGVNCAVFRNEGPTQASDLIKSAMELAWGRWPGERLYTYVNPKFVKSKNPGYCFIMANWKRCGFSKGGLLILDCEPPVQPTGNDPSN